MRKEWIVAALAALSLSAAEAEDEKELGWSGKLAFGYLSVSGNTESDSINLDALADYRAERWQHTFRGRAIGQTQNDETTAEAYKAAVESKFDITERTYAFGLLEYNKDKFSAYDQQIFEIVGLGRRVLDTKKHTLNAQVGVGATQNDLRDGTEEDEFVTRLGADYTWQISETAKFSQILNVNISSSNTFTESISELRATVIGNLGMALSYTIKNNSDVPVGTKKTDTWTAISLDYEF